MSFQYQAHTVQVRSSSEMSNLNLSEFSAIVDPTRWLDLSRSKETIAVSHAASENDSSGDFSVGQRLTVGIRGQLQSWLTVLHGDCQALTLIKSVWRRRVQTTACPSGQCPGDAPPGKLAGKIIHGRSFYLTSTRNPWYCEGEACPAFSVNKCATKLLIRAKYPLEPLSFREYTTAKLTREILPPPPLHRFS